MMWLIFTGAWLIIVVGVLCLLREADRPIEAADGFRPDIEQAIREALDVVQDDTAIAHLEQAYRMPAAVKRRCAS